jgi:hypothetical protein
MHHNRVHPSVRDIYVGFEFNHRIPPSVRQAGLCLRPSVFISPRPRAAFSGWPGVGTGVTRWDADHASADECFNFFLGITNFRQDCSVVLSKRRSRTTNARRGRGEPDRRSFGCTSIGRLSTSSSRSPIFPTGDAMLVAQFEPLRRGSSGNDHLQFATKKGGICSQLLHRALLAYQIVAPPGANSAS